MVDDPSTLGFPQCPNCGSEKRLANEVLLKEVEKGKVNKSTHAYLYTHKSVIAKDMRWLSAPIVSTFYDVCVDCGTVWCFHANVKIAVQGGKSLPPTSMPFSTS